MTTSLSCVVETMLGRFHTTIDPNVDLTPGPFNAGPLETFDIFDYETD